MGTGRFATLLYSTCRSFSRTRSAGLCQWQVLRRPHRTVDLPLHSLSASCFPLFPGGRSELSLPSIQLALTYLEGLISLCARCCTPACVTCFHRL
ncbi:hypothetical protein PAXRUDRAFT_303631 [Paxillus rubicundulus Ve08.2h10]|uniref:Uncharacterized protein n=1 Tax=Paxillus rubicundulus Ve08.2h10 TaxID=930991 RepID=A0A0D0E041_9AGAM|nr:hypothetical protein PAXRUDRAFT_303631 [Paxillus rubicundulus Ve08.2h10]